MRRVALEPANKKRRHDETGDHDRPMRDMRAKNGPVADQPAVRLMRHGMRALLAEGRRPPMGTGCPSTVTNHSCSAPGFRSASSRTLPKTAAKTGDFPNASASKPRHVAQHAKATPKAAASRRSSAAPVGCRGAEPAFSLRHPSQRRNGRAGVFRHVRLGSPGSGRRNARAAATKSRGEAHALQTSNGLTGTPEPSARPGVR
jgi:hypothetical protein